MIDFLDQLQLIKHRLYGQEKLDVHFFNIKVIVEVLIHVDLVILIMI
jgi:hypothetical protein